MNKHTFIIAEAGVNHNGNMEIAKRLIDTAYEAGVDAVKFQTFKAENLASEFAPQAQYQQKTTGQATNQLTMLKNLELGVIEHHDLISYCRQKGVKFLSSPFDLESVELLNKLEMEIIKIPSGEITNLPYLKKVGSLNKKVIVSTGMAELSEIGEALNILIGAGTKKEDITVLHCNTEYPTPKGDVNLLAMLTIKKTFNVAVGYSDHTLGIEVPIAAVALGAVVIEKHFTLDNNMEGPDHQASLNPQQLTDMVKAIRNIELAMGDGVKRPSSSELKNISIVRKSIVAAKSIAKGVLFTEENITAKRLGIGISPMEWSKVIGKCAKRDFKKDEAIEL